MSYDPQNSAKNSPNHFIVLDAIARGIKSVDKISKATRLPQEEVELIVNDLSLQRLTVREKKRRFFGGSKLEVKGTVHVIFWYYGYLVFYIYDVFHGNGTQSCGESNGFK